MNFKKQRLKELLTPVVQNILNEEKPYQDLFHSADSLVRGITYEDLINVLVSNEPKITEDVVMKVFRELMREQLDDARYDLKKNMQKIITSATKNR